MTTDTVRLVYEARSGDLSFRDGSGGKRRVLPGVPFEVDAATAAILTTDPHVTPADPDDGSARNDAEDPAPSGLERYAALKLRAKELGLPASGKADELAAAIAAEENRLAVAAEAQRLADEAAAAAAQASGSGESGTGDSKPAYDPGAVASGEAGTPAESGTGSGGAIVLGDLPASAKIGG